jgi:hypothetical protein
VAFLNEHAFKVPDYLINPDIINRIDQDGVADRILSSQRGLLASLLDDSRVKRMSEHANRDPKSAYNPADLLLDLHLGIFGELSANQNITLYRRNLQRAAVEMLGTPAASTSTSSDLPALARAELKRIQAEATGARASAVLDRDPIVAAHLDDLLARIQRIFEPKDKPETPTVTIPRRTGGVDERE